MELEMKCFNDSLIPLMQEENTLSTRYRKLIASAKIMWEGEELNLSLMSKYMRSSDRDTRKKAGLLMPASLKIIRKSLMKFMISW